MKSQKTIEALAAQLVKAKANGTGGSLLIGEGCSLQAGLPSSVDLVEVIKSKYPKAYQNAATKDLQGCAAGLTPVQKEELLEAYMDGSKLNWANLCIAMMMQQGYFNRVWTVNSHSLLTRACSLMGEFPAVYDCSGATLASPDKIASKAIFHINGFSLGGTPLSIDNAFMGVPPTGPFLVAGYGGGIEDPVIEYLAKLCPFENGLYWSSDEGQAPSKVVRETLLTDEKNGFCIVAEDADSFLAELTQKLKIPPPDWIANPFSHLGSMLKSVMSYPIAGYPEGIHITDLALLQTQAAIQKYEGPDRGKNLIKKSEVAGDLENPELLQAIQTARHGMLSGDTAKIVQQRGQYDKTLSPPLADLLFWAYEKEGDNVFAGAQSQSGKPNAAQLEAAQQHYESALKLKPVNYQVHFKLGQLFAALAKVREGGGLETCLKQAGQEFKQALDLKPDLHDAYYGWGQVLLAQAKGQDGSEAESLYTQAIEKFRATLKAQPDNGEAAHGCGMALYTLARRKQGNDALRMYGQAAEKLQIALKAFPDRIEALLAMGQALLVYARSKTGEEGGRMLALSAEKFENAVRVDPNLAEAYMGWADVLLERGQSKNDSKADDFFYEAIDKFKKVLEIQPNAALIPFRWGMCLLSLAERKTGEAVSQLLNDAAEKFQATLNQDPKNYDALNKLGDVYFNLGQSKKGLEAEALLSKASEKYKEALKINPKNAEALTNCGSVFFQMAQAKKGGEAESLLKQTIQQGKQALEIQPDFLDAMMLCGNSLFQLARLKSGSESEDLIQKAEKIYQKALKVQPNDCQALTNWGAIVLKKAKGLAGEQAEKLLTQAANSFQEALEIKEEFAEALNLMADTLIEQAKSKRGINAHPLLAEAKGKLQKAEELQPGVGAFNMARLMAQLANESSCREWLGKCRDNGTLPDPKELINDILFQSVRDSKWFKTMVSLPEEPEKMESQSAPQDQEKAQNPAGEQAVPAAPPKKDQKKPKKD